MACYVKALSSTDKEKLRNYLVNHPTFMLYHSNHVIHDWFRELTDDNLVNELPNPMQIPGIVISRYISILDNRCLHSRKMSALGYFLTRMQDSFQGRDSTSEFFQYLIETYNLLDIPPHSESREKSIISQNNKDVFISYARQDIDSARLIHKSLENAGFKVFRDEQDIKPSMNWDLSIEYALRQANCLVLLMTPNSMPYRKEVYREWFAFDMWNKPIYPLNFGVNKNDINTRLLSTNYIDIEGDITQAMQRLTNALNTLCKKN